MAENNEPIIRFTEGINLNDLLSKEGATFEINFDDLIQNEEVVETSYDRTEVLSHVKFECCGLNDEDTYQDCMPFEHLATKMTNLLDDGKIKKRILREGYGVSVPPASLVTIDYNAYVEFNDEPFDSTYLRKKPFTFQLGVGGALPGLNMSVETMKINEKAQFLVSSDYAYGDLGCLDRIPPMATILFEVELKNFADAKSKSSTNKNPEEETQNMFSDIYRHALAVCSKAKDMYAKGLSWPASREYNMAISKLEWCNLKNREEEQQQQKLLLRLYSNQVVVYTKLQEPRRACKNYNKISEICKGNTLKASAKVYFNHARSLMQLGDYKFAEIQLKKAQKMEPQNGEIVKEFKKLDMMVKVNYERELAIAKGLFVNTEINKELNDKSEITKEFQATITQCCLDLLKDTANYYYPLPPSMRDAELEFVKNEVQNHGLRLEQSKGNYTKKYFIAKPRN